ncbi:hypothetical protein [Staphylococcus capitis]|nr:hypothetical protein [Staphylococcus capitis]
MIVDGRGEVLIEGNDGGEVIECEMNIEEVEVERGKIGRLDI